MSFQPDPTDGNPDFRVVDIVLPHFCESDDVLVLAVLRDGTLIFNRTFDTDDRETLLNFCGPVIGETILDATLKID